MRVGLVVYGSLDQLSGGYLYDRKLVEHLQNKGHVVQVVSIPWRNYAIHISDNFSNPLFQRFKTLNVDLLIQDELNHPSLFLLNNRLRSGVSYPIISIVHHLRSSEQHPRLFAWVYSLVERSYLNSVDGFIFNSHTSQRVVENLTTEIKPSVVAQPGGDRLTPDIDDEEILARSRAAGPLRIVFLGNLIKRKAPHLLIQAAASLQDITVSFAGSERADRRYATWLKREVVGKNLGERVHFLGYLEQRELNPLLGDSHVLVVPSSYEGYGIAYLEGMGFGLPAIGTRAGAASEIITHGKDGFLIDVNNAADLIDHLRRLHEDRDLLTAMSLAARKRYLEHPTWQTSMLRVADFLSSYNSQNPAISYRRNL